MDRIGTSLPPTLRGEPTKHSNIALSLSAERAKERESKERIARRAAISILSSYRKSDTDDPATYVEACARVLMAYPDDIIRAVADPLTGIAGEQTFLPSIAELRASLERRHAPMLARQRHEEELARTREIIDEAPDRPTQAQRDLAVEHWERTKAEMRGGVSREEARQQAEKRVSELYRESLEPRTLTIGPGLAAKLIAMAQETAAQAREV